MLQFLTGKRRNTDAHSKRYVLPVSMVLGAERLNARELVQVSPLPYDRQFDPIPLSEFPVRPARASLAIQSFGQYQEIGWPSTALKHEFIPLESGDSESYPAEPPTQFGGWISFDEYRLSLIGEPRGSAYQEGV